MENNLKRFLSLLLALVMVIGLMPVGHVHAEEGNTINLVVGDTHEITLDGDYSSLNGTGNEVVSVDAEFTPKLTAYTVSNTTTDATLESGKYVLQNTRVSKFLESTSEGGKLWLAAKLITTAETWTITKVDDGYTMKASNGQYLTFDGSSSSLTDTETVLSFTWKDTSTWQIGCGGQYLNSYDSEQKVAGWWQDGDAGSQWRLYKVTDQPAYTWTLGDAVSQIEDGGYYIFENNEASSRAASLVSSKWNNTNNGGGGSGYGLLMEHNKTNFGEQDIWKITGTAGEYHVQDCHGWNLLVASGKATLTPESQTTVIGQDSTSYEGKWQISVGGVHLNWWGGSNGDGVQVAGWGDVNDRNSQWNIYEVIPTALGSTTIALTALKAGTAEITIGDTTYHIHVTDGTGEHEHSYTGEVTTPATCTEDGVMTYTCVCGERYTEVIPATGHAPVTTGYKKPTLCEPGATGTTSCGVCGEVFSESTAINQLPVASVLHDNKIVALNGCEYTYNASNSSFTHTDANGTVYSVKPSAGVGVQQPALIPQTTAEVFSVSLIWGSGDFAGRVQISGNGSIHFHTNADKPYWNKCGSGSDENSDWTNHGLYLFVAGGDSAEFPGYTQVTSAEGMVDGGNYLIAARTDDDHGGKWYVMRPTAGTNEFMHVAQYTGMKEITGHTPGEKVRVNEVAATCGAAGSYDEVIYCTVCGAEMERTTVTVDATGEHIYDNAYDTDCNVCGADREVPFSSEKIPGESILGKGSSVDTSEPAYDKSVGNAFDGDYNTFWATDPGHGLSEAYLIADLGGKYLINQVAYTKRIYNGSYDCTGNLLDYIIEVSTDGETWKQVADGETEGGTTVITFDAVEAAYVRLTATRSYHWEEENRNKVMTAAELEIFKLVCTEHTPAAEAVKENEKAATCTETGSYDSVVYCSVCCAELSRETIAVDALGHNYEAVVTAPTCTEGGYTTYTCDLCGDSYVADETSALGHSYEKGFCTVCGGYEVPELNAEGYYEIGNAGQLYWFADQVNNGANNINAILTDKIVVNENLMEKITIAEDGTATVNEGETIREWAPIGGSIYPYSGTFDGNGKTVTGLYRNVSANYVGLIGYLEGSGKVQNVTVADSYFCGGNCVGGVVGYSCAGSTVSNCHNTGSVSGGDDVGGVVGNNGGSMTECCNAGTVSGSNYVGGVAGWNADSTLSNCYNTGTVSGNDYVGGVAGFCFTATLSNCYNTGTVSGGDYVGGVVGLNDDGGTVSNCYNTGSVSGGGYVGGVVGYCYIGGTVSNCYNTGSINAGMFNGGVVGVNNGTMSNCFYLDTCGAEGEGTAKTEAQFASGEVAWLLNGSTDEGELVWKQNIGTDAIPGFEGEIVSYSSKTGAYYNKGNHEHQYEAVVTDPTCTEPGYTTYTCTVCGDTYTGDETTALGHTASEAVRENEVAPTLNSEGSYESVVYCSVCSTELSRTTVTVPVLEGAVAQVNGVKYATLTEAIEKASGNMAVHMLSDVTEDIVIDKALILLMNSHTLYGQVKITGPNVQIQGCINTSTDPKGKIVAEGKDAIVIGVKDQKNENISVYANFVDVTSTTDCALLIYDGKATFNNSDLISTSTSYAAVQGSGRDFGDVSMSLCNVTSEHEVAIYWPHVGTLTVNNDCTITGATGLYIKQGKANLYSCTVKGTGAQVAHKVNNNGGDSTGDAITIDKGATEPVVNTSANLISENGNLVGMYGGTVELFGANLTAKKNAIRMEDGVLTLRGMTINAGYCALFIRGGEVNMSGTTMNSTGDYATIQGNGTCGGDVTIRSGTVSSANNIAIYWPGSGNLTVMDATVTGATAIYAKQGNVTISGGTFRATGEKADFSHSGNGAYATGDAVVLESCDYGTLTASITYGRFISEHGKAVAAYAQPGHTELSGFITGGHYNTAVDADYLAEGYCAALTGEYYSVAQHYYFSEVTDPDCENGGYTTHTCGRCGASYITDEIPALGHTEEVIPGKDATCTETGLTEGKKCTVCGETTVAQQEIPALGHKPGEAVVENEKAATCTETGSYDTVVYCSVCSEELSRETVTVPALGHKDEDNNFECDVCGEDLCTEHVEEIVKGYAATCTEPGLTDGKKCTVCGETTVAQEEIPALGHNYEAVVTAPTCTEGGYTTYTCSRCDDTYTGDETTALGHTASEAVKENEKAATCTETGSYDSVVCCSVCSAEMSRETVTVDALGHKEEAIPGKDATCTETGLTEGKKCTVCGETTVAQQEIPALGHDWLEDGSCSRCEERKEEEMENPFVDVPADEYYLEPVLWAVGKGITSGTSENTFSPYRIITRGQAVTFLWRAMGSPEPAMTINPFVDVAETDYYYKAVLWAAEKGITAGVGDNRFAPSQECTRAQILTFLWVAMDKPASDVEVNFNDVHEGDYYYNAVAWAYENGITAGMGGGAFGVGILCTRAHVITFLYRAAA